MTKQDSVTVTVPGNVHVIQPTYALVSGSQEKPSEMTSYPASATVLQYNTGSQNLQNPHIVIQNPAGMTGLQAQPTGLQYPVGMAGAQTPPGMIQFSPEATSVQILPGDPQNPPNTIPGPTQTSSHPQWNISFMSIPEFNPKKFINEETRTLGAIQILIGLFHVVSATNPQLYKDLLGVSGYLVWGGLSFIISGSLSVLAEKAASSCMVNGSIGMNIISSIISLLGVIIIIVDLCTHRTSDLLMGFKMAVSGVLLPFAFLEFILTCVVSHFGCQAVCWTHFENMTPISTMFSGVTVNNNTGPVNTTTGPVNTTTGPVNTTTGPVVNTTSPISSATNIPVQPTLPSNAHPEHSYQVVTDVAQK